MRVEARKQWSGALGAALGVVAFGLAVLVAGFTGTHGPAGRDGVGHRPEAGLQAAGERAGAARGVTAVTASPSWGAGVTVFVLDSGVAEHKRTGAVERPRGSGECPWHGTAVASVLTNVASAVRIVDVPVLGCDNQTDTATLDEALGWVVANHTGGVAIVNMSLSGNLQLLHSRFVELVDAGVVPVLAAGNQGVDNCQEVPDVPELLVVGASDGREPWSKSNHGACVDVWAPGVAEVVASDKSRTSETVMSGTSLAVPHVAGAVARLVEGSSLAGSAGVQTVVAEVLARTETRDGLRFLDPFRVGRLGVPWGAAALAGDRSVTFSWYDTWVDPAGLERWELTIETKHGTKRVEVSAGEVTRDGTKVRVTFTAPAGRAHRVRVSRAGGLASRWSSRATPVKVAGQTKPRAWTGVVPGRPSTRAQGGARTVTVAWKPVFGAERYEVSWVANGVEHGRVSGTGAKLTLARVPAGRWAVRVRAVSTAGQSPWSKRVVVRVTP